MSEDLVLGSRSTRPPSEGDRGERSEPRASGEGGRDAPDPEVVAKPKRRTFSASYKARIIAEADACTDSGEVGRLLRREGLYSSHLTAWRKAQRRGALDALDRRKRKGKPRADQALEKENRRLERENSRLREDLRKANLILEVQGKVSRLLDIDLSDERNS